MTFYGPNLLRFTRRKDDYPLTPETEEWFHRAFEPEPLGRVFEDPENPYVLTLGGGAGEGPLVGGCLTLLCSSIGTPYEFEAEGCVLMVEDLNTETVPGRHRDQPPDPGGQARRRRRASSSART